MRFEALLQEYLSFLVSVRGVAPKTGRRHATHVRRWLEFLSRREVFDPSAIRPVHIDAFLQSRGRNLARSTMAGITTALRGWLRYLAFRGLVAPSLAAGVYGPRLYALESLPRCLTHDELRRFFAAIDTSKPSGRRDYALFMLMLSSGVRLGETLALRLDDINWEQRTLHVRSSKTRRSRVVPFAAEAGTALIRYLQRDRRACDSVREVFLGFCCKAGRPLQCVSTMMEKFRRYARKAGLQQRATSHALRHTFAQNVLDGGADHTTLQNLLGHTSPTWISIYAKVSIEALREVADNYAEQM